jgi:hypothetical protein
MNLSKILKNTIAKESLMSIRNIQNIRPSLVKILNVLGFASIEDRKTIVPPDIFDNLNVRLVFRLIKDYRLNISLDNLSSERKLEIINLILELYHDTTIDFAPIDSGIPGYSLYYFPTGGSLSIIA